MEVRTSTCTNADMLAYTQTPSHKHNHTQTHVHMRIRTSVLVYVHAWSPVRVPACLHACMNACVRVCVHGCLHACVIYMRLCVRVCVCACVWASGQACVRERVRAGLDLTLHSGRAVVSTNRKNLCKCGGLCNHSEKKNIRATRLCL